MARYYISADLEGVCGVTSPLQCYPLDDRSGYDMAVGQLALEINTVANTILEADPTAEIVVNDAHSTMTNLTPDMLLPQVQLLTGKPKRCAMVAGLDATFDAALFIGYHARAGVEKGVLNHTFHSKLFDVQINGVSYGEGGINALYASLQFQVPLILASGDRAFCEEIKPLVAHIRTVETKVGLTTTAARCASRDAVLSAYREQTLQAVRDLLQWPKARLSERLIAMPPPYTLEITFTTSLSCDVVVTSPLYTQINGRTVQLITNNFQELYQGLQAAYTMLGYTDFMGV